MTPITVKLPTNGKRKNFGGKAPRSQQQQQQTAPKVATDTEKQLNGVKKRIEKPKQYYVIDQTKIQRVYINAAVHIAKELGIDPNVVKSPYFGYLLKDSVAGFAGDLVSLQYYGDSYILPQLTNETHLPPDDGTVKNAELKEIFNRFKKNIEVETPYTFTNKKATPQKKQQQQTDEDTTNEEICGSC